MLYAMFYFLRDGSDILEKIFYYTPLSHGDEVRVLERLRSVTRATIKGTIVIGMIQGTLAGLGLLGRWARWRGLLGNGHGRALDRAGHRRRLSSGCQR